MKRFIRIALGSVAAVFIIIGIYFVYFLTNYPNVNSPKSMTINPDSMKYYTLMPWTLLAGMTDEDLGSIYTHLHSINSVKHKVDRFTPNNN